MRKLVLIPLALLLFAAPAQCPNQPGPAGNKVETTPVDGGQNYYGQFTNGLPTTPDHFPIGGWLRPALDRTQVNNYVDFGMNLFVGVECPECANEALFRAAGLKTLIQAGERTRFNDIGSVNAGWLIGDELDMCCGPPGFGGGNGYNMLANTNNGLPSDGKARYANYGKGVMFWKSDSDAARFFPTSVPVHPEAQSTVRAMRTTGSWPGQSMPRLRALRRRSTLRLSRQAQAPAGLSAP
jgi:hypothetical protein